MANEYKKTMNLPATDFAMRASLSTREPERLKAWEENKVYDLLLKKHEDDPLFVLHDGPPYANGPIHIGHALNKISKDIINRYKSMRGYKTPYIPGWDCHGQPIEHKVEQTLGSEKFNNTAIEEIRALCRDYAVENVDVQRQGFKRLGVLADWEQPYLTFTNDYDAADIEVFRRIFQRGAIYRGSKPVHWCSSCHTALAEAEIEYGDEVSPSIFVRFELKSKPLGLESFDKVDIVIWTTTPWTLPANAGVAVHPEARYVALVHEGRALILAEELASARAEDFGFEGTRAQSNGQDWVCKGRDLCGLLYHHPIFDEAEGRVIEADYVSLEDGTGCVHTAPGHGVDDYNAGQKQGLPIIMPVDDEGRLIKGEGLGTGGRFGGLKTDEANPKIIEYLKDKTTLLLQRDINHSYPHCWRCKNPVIFRATKQWFVSMDETGLRDEALDAINNKVQWYPAHASKRIGSMVEGRPDWCISRQRCWGVPIPSFSCKDCGATVMNESTIERVVELFKEEGSDAWFVREPASYLGDACVCPECGSHNLKADRDILDVWWDSGVSHTAVCEAREELRRPADIYLEGSDQHRGWFQSSLLTSVGAYGEAPYKGVVSQGFVLDGQGRKMSKSLGNVVDPNAVCDQRGADIIRLWVASADTQNDVSIDDEILNHVGDAYRRFRNTFRFLLGELEAQFDPATEALSFDELSVVDKLALARMCEVHEAVEQAYEGYRFNQVYRLLYDYIITDLSNGYLNATKDRMYCDAKDSLSRRSAQTVWSHMLAMLLSDLQPILAYTTDELMDYIPESLRQGQKFAALLNWYTAPLSKDEYSALLPAYRKLFELRNSFTKAFELAKDSERFDNKTTTQAVNARFVLTQAAYDELTAQGLPDLAEICVCATAEFEVSEAESGCEVELSDLERCPRCWNWRELGPDGLCARCSEVVSALED